MFNYNENRSWSENISIVMQLGLTMAGSVLFCLFVGKWLDNQLNCHGVFTCVFILFGVFGGGNVCYRQILSATMISKRN